MPSCLKFLRSTYANVAIEFVFIAPVMIILLSGIYELTNYILLHNKLTRAAGVIGDMIARQNLTRVTLTSYLKTAKDVVYPFDFNSNGAIIASQIQNVGLTSDPMKMQISWQQNWNGGLSRIGNLGNTPQNLPNNITIIQNQNLIVTEIFYNYTPLIFIGFFPSKLLYKVMIYVPRSGTMNTLLGE